MAFIQDPRLRQRWNQLSHTTEAVTSDAAAGIWSFGHRYVGPCVGAVAGAVDACVSVCVGGRDERARRARERDRGARRVEHSFDFYDDWEADLDAEFPGFVGGADEDGLHAGGAGGGGSGSGGLWGGWMGRGENWDRLLAGTGSGHRGSRGVGGSGAGGGDVVDQPRRRRGMSYGTRGAVRRKVSSEEDPNVIPRTAPLGFLGRLPFKIVGSLRYKPSAANLREHPGSGGTAQGYQGSAGQEEREPLLGSSEEEDAARRQKASPRQRARSRSDTTTSGDTSSSYRSRGDLFPSDGEGDEDAVPLDDEFTVALERVDDQGSTRTHNSKGKRPADRDRNLSRTHSRTTLSSGNTPNDSRGSSNPVSPSRTMEEAMGFPSLEDLQREEEQAEREEHEELERRRQAAAQLAVQRGLSKDPSGRASEATGGIEGKDGSLDREAPLRPPEGQVPGASPGATGDAESGEVEVEEPKPRSAISPEPALSPTLKANGESRVQSTFVPARLPHFD